MITISHTHADGTMLTGSRRGDGVYDLVRGHGFRSSSAVGIYIRGSRDRDAQRWRIDAAATALRSAGFDVTVDIDDQWRPAADREAARADRADERVDRLDARATTASARADAAQQSADRVFGAIPFGQPMMPGHHSYRADRNRREKASANQDRARAAGQDAARLADRSGAVVANLDAKDNPRAIMRRIERLAVDLRRWERERDHDGISDGYRGRIQREIDRLTEDIAHQQAKLDARAESGEFVAWSPENLAVGDSVRVGGHGWYRVIRVNRKTVSLDSTVWPQKVTFDEVFGLRRDGWQYDTPNGQPWPVDLAVAVARWQRLQHSARSAGYEPEAQDHARRVRWAARLVHGLDLSAADAEVAAFAPVGDGSGEVRERRRLAAAYLEVFDRLSAGEAVPDIVASLPPEEREPVWRRPPGDPVDRRARDLCPGDVVAGLWETSFGERALRPECVGPVAHVEGFTASGEQRAWWRITLGDGASRDVGDSQWLAVYPLADRVGVDAR